MFLKLKMFTRFKNIPIVQIMFLWKTEKSHGSKYLFTGFKKITYYTQKSTIIIKIKNVHEFDIIWLRGWQVFMYFTTNNSSDVLKKRKETWTKDKKNYMKETTQRRTRNKTKSIKRNIKWVEKNKWETKHKKWNI
jgi:hypothetical protein